MEQERKTTCHENRNEPEKQRLHARIQDQTIEHREKRKAVRMDEDWSDFNEALIPWDLPNGQLTTSKDGGMPLGFDVDQSFASRNDASRKFCWYLKEYLLIIHCPHRNTMGIIMAVVVLMKAIH